jgi:hypothetical protein
MSKVSHTHLYESSNLLSPNATRRISIRPLKQASVIRIGEEKKASMTYCKGIGLHCIRARVSGKECARKPEDEERLIL